MGLLIVWRKLQVQESIVDVRSGNGGVVGNFLKCYQLLSVGGISRGIILSVVTQPQGMKPT